MQINSLSLLMIFTLFVILLPYSFYALLAVIIISLGIPFGGNTYVVWQTRAVLQFVQ